MTVNIERQAFRALKLLPIEQLPPYAANAAVACRVGKAVSAHAMGPWSMVLQSRLESVLRDQPRPFLYRCPVSGQLVQAMVDGDLIGPATVYAPMDCPFCNRPHIVHMADEVASDGRRAGTYLT